MQADMTKKSGQTDRHRHKKAFTNPLLLLVTVFLNLRKHLLITSAPFGEDNVAVGLVTLLAVPTDEYNVAVGLVTLLDGDGIHDGCFLCS